MFKAYKYRLYPSDRQKEILSKHFGGCRFVWNHFLDLRSKQYAETGKGMTYNRMSLELKKLKHDGDHAWLGETNSQSLQQVLMHLDTAYTRFFNDLGEFPVFKHKSGRQSFTVPQRFRVEGNKLFIPNVGGIRLFMHRAYEGDIRNVTISKNPSGKYYASLMVQLDNVAMQPEDINANSAVSIDVGLKAFATLSNGLQIANPKYLKRAEKQLKKAQRSLARKKKGSKNRREARVVVARAEEHVANQRRDFHDKVSDALLNAYDTIIVEDLNVSGMMLNHKLAQAIADVGWSSFITMLKTKALQRGKSVIEIGRFQPSSKMCSRCGNIKRDLKLSDRIYHCNVCGLTIDRDLNAAINIKRFGMISVDVPTDSGEFTPVDRGATTLFQLEREGIVQVHWLKQEAYVL